MNQNPELVWLRPFGKPDFNRLINWIPDEKALRQFAGSVFSYPLNETQLDLYISDSRRLAFVVMSGNTVIGHAEIYYESPEVVKLCRILIGDAKMRGQGKGLTLTNMLLAKAFYNPAVDRVFLNVFDWNFAAIKCYTNAGFIRDPGVSGSKKAEDEGWNVVRMVIQRNDFNNHHGDQ